MLQGWRSCREGVRSGSAKRHNWEIQPKYLLSTYAPPPCWGVECNLNYQSPTVVLEGIIPQAWQSDEFSKSRTKGSEPTSVRTRTWRSEICIAISQSGLGACGYCAGIQEYLRGEGDDGPSRVSSRQRASWTPAHTSVRVYPRGLFNPSS